MSSYLHYLEQKPSFLSAGEAGGELLVGSVVPSYLVYFASFLFFVGLNLFLPVVFRHCFSETYFSMSPQHKGELSGYLVCICHHIAIAPLGAYYIWNNYGAYLVGEEVSSAVYTTISHGTVATVGYLGGDILFSAIPEMIQRRKYDNFIHHGLTLGLFVCVLKYPLTVMKYMPHYYVCEITPLLYSSLWFIRRGGYGGSVAEKSVQLIFAGTFFVGRVVNLTLVNRAAIINYYDHFRIVGSGVLIALTILQVFWFGKIVQIALGSPRKTKRE